jgi:hypothetical protein
MLPNPFLGGYYNMLFPGFVKQGKLPVFIAYFKRIGWEIKRLQLIHVESKVKIQK